MSLPVNKVIVGDCVEVMQTWPAGSVNLVVTSPPYWGLRFYGEETVRVWGGDPECEHSFSLSAPPPRKRSKKDIVNQNSIQSYKDNPSAYDSTESCFCSKCGAWRGSLGLEPHPQLFIDHLVEICREIKRVLKPSGTFWLNLGDTYCSSGKWVNKKLGDIGKQNRSVEGGSVDAYSMRGKLKPDGGWIQPKQKLMIPARVAIALQHEGWILRNDIIWEKPNAMPSSVKDRLTCVHEHVFLFAKQRRCYFDLDAIRVPHKENTLQREEYGHKISKFMGGQNRHKELLEKGFIKMNMSPLGKNPGDIWRIPTTPFPGSHFAVFPPKLIEPIVKAGCPRWICSRCGKPRTRITEKKGYIEHPQREGRNVKAVQFSKEENKYVSGGTLGLISQEKTVDWSDCGCGEDWVGGVVLDPFAGSGTALRVARKLGRRFIGIEINPEYAAMAEERVRSDKYSPAPPGGVKLTDLMETEK